MRPPRLRTAKGGCYCPTAPSCNHIKPRQCPILIASGCQCYTEDLLSDVIYDGRKAIEREIEGETEL